MENVLTFLKIRDIYLWMCEMKIKVAIIVILWGCFFCSNAFSDDWDIKRLTNKSYFGYGISMYGNKLAWHGYTSQNPNGGASSAEIFYYDGSDTHQLTSTGNWNMFPKISSGGIAWAGNMTTGQAVGDVMYYDFKDTHILATNAVNSVGVNAYGNKVVWSDYASKQIMLYENGSISSLPGAIGSSPRISSGGVIYTTGASENNHIKLNDWNLNIDLGETTDSDAQQGYPNQQINGNKVTWFKNIGGYEKNEVMVRDIDTGIITQITSGNIQYGQPSQPVVWNNYVAWYDRGRGGSQPIKLYDGQSITTITNTEWISNMSFGDGYLAFSMGYNGKTDLFTYDLNTKSLTQLTDDALNESYIVASGNYIAYLVSDPSPFCNPNDIYVAHRNIIPEPATILMLGIGTLVFRKRK